MLMNNLDAEVAADGANWCRRRRRWSGRATGEKLPAELMRGGAVMVRTTTKRLLVRGRQGSASSRRADAPRCRHHHRWCRTGPTAITNKLEKLELRCDGEGAGLTLGCISAGGHCRAGHLRCHRYRRQHFGGHRWIGSEERRHRCRWWRESIWLARVSQRLHAGARGRDRRVGHCAPAAGVATTTTDGLVGEAAVDPAATWVRTEVLPPAVKACAAAAGGAEGPPPPRRRSPLVSVLGRPDRRRRSDGLEDKRREIDHRW